MYYMKKCFLFGFINLFVKIEAQLTLKLLVFFWQGPWNATVTKNVMFKKPLNKAKVTVFTKN